MSGSHSRTAAHVLLVVLALVLVGCDSEPATGPEASQADDPCAATQPITMGEVGSGALSDRDCVEMDGRYADRWSLRVEEPMTVRIDLTSQQFDTWLEIRDQGGSTVAVNDDAGATLNSRLVEPLAAGDYVVVATSYLGGETGSYQLLVAEAADCSPVGSLDVGDTVQGTLTDDDCYWEYGTLADNWSLSIGSSQDVRIAMRSEDFQEGVVVKDANGTILWGEAAYDPDDRAQFDIRLEAGEYTVVASALYDGATGSYELSVVTPPPCGPGTALELDVDVEGELTDDDCALLGYGVADSYTLELVEETSIDFVLKSSEFPPVIVVRDSDGTEVAWGYQYTAAGTATLRAVLGAGTYEVMPTSYYGDARGGYRLTVSEGSCSEPGEVALGETVSGTITEQDCLFAEGRYRDAWSVTLDATTTVQIDLTSSDFDAYLVLADDAGTEIETDDDGGTGTNARIERELSAGTYEILVSTWGPYQFGEYDLTVAEAGPAPATADAPGSVKVMAAPAVRERIAAPGGAAGWWMADPAKAERF